LRARQSSQFNDPIRNRQVMGSTPIVGSMSPISSKPASGDRFKTSHLFELLNGLGLVGKPGFLVLRLIARSEARAKSG